MVVLRQNAVEQVNSESSATDALSVEESIYGVLISDVARSVARYSADKSQANARDVVRVALAAIEGVHWQVKTRLLQDAQHLSCASVHEIAALSDESFNINERGVVRAQDRYVPILAAIRLTIRIASRCHPTFEADLGHEGWRSLVLAVKVRNRITHPKDLRGLAVQDSEVRACISACEWFFARGIEVLTESRNYYRNLADRLEQRAPVVLPSAT